MANATSSHLDYEMQCLLRGISSKKKGQHNRPKEHINKSDSASAQEDKRKKVPKVKVAGDGLSQTSKVGIEDFAELSSKDKLKIPKWLTSGAGIATNGASSLTPIQRHAIPVALERRDLIAIAPTGSGKTLSFLIPTVATTLRAKRIEMKKALAHEEKKSMSPEATSVSESKRGRHYKSGPYAIMISPTRELASQTCRELRRLVSKAPKKKRLSILLVTNTVSSNYNKNKIKHDEVEEEGIITHDLVVSTPPRLAQLVEKSKVSLSRVRMIVLDEADKLFGDDGTFIQHIDTLVAKCTHKKLQRCVYTATLPELAEELLRNVMIQPIRITVGERNAPCSLVEQKLIFCGDESVKDANSDAPTLSGKLSAIRQMIAKGEFIPPVLVFAQSKERASQLYHALKFDGIKIDLIHSDRSPKERARAVQNFRAGGTWILVTTDLMARGMDILGVNTVINFDCPVSRSDYVHRVGRTGRAGHKGTCITFYTEEDFRSLHMIASAMAASGSKVPEWMLKLPRRHGGGKTKYMPPKRSNIIDLKGSNDSEKGKHKKRRKSDYAKVHHKNTKQKKQK